MAPTTVRVRASADQEVAARLLTDRNLLAIPVVDDDDHLIGIITEDDVADVLQAEATEDIERLGGSQPLNIPYRLSNVPLLVRKRVGWLLVLFIAEAYTGTVLRGFEGELAAVVSLGFFIPLLIGTGRQHRQPDGHPDRARHGHRRGDPARPWLDRVQGAAGRADHGRRDGPWSASRWPALLGVGSDVGLVVALTIVAISTWSAIVAAFLPLVVRRLGVDPAVVSAPLITTLVDGTGLIIYFEVARIVLGL